MKSWLKKNYPILLAVMIVTAPAWAQTVNVAINLLTQANTWTQLQTFTSSNIGISTGSRLGLGDTVTSSRPFAFGGSVNGTINGRCLNSDNTNTDSRCNFSLDAGVNEFYFQVQAASGNAVLGTSTSTPLHIVTGNSDALIIDTDHTLNFGVYDGTPCVVAGSISIKDLAGNTRKLMVCS